MAKAKSRRPAKPVETTPDKIMWWCLRLMVLLVPLAISNLSFLQGIIPTANIPLTYDQFDIVKVVTMRGLAIVGLAAWAWARLTKGGSVRRTKIDWLILAFLAWVLLTTITSIHPPTAVFGKYRRYEGLISFVTYAVIYFLTVQAVDRPSRMRELARVLSISGFIVGLYGVFQYLGVDLITWGRLPFEENRAFATYGNPDLLGGFLMFPLPVSLALALSEKQNGWRWFYWITFAVLVLCWVVAFVRGAWIGGVVGIGIVAVVAFRKRARLELPDRVVLGGGVVAGIAVLARSLMASNATLNIAQRVSSIFEFGSGSAKTRFEIWDAAWRATIDRPITGFGADTFRLVFPQYKPIEYVRDAGYLSVADNVHNYPLQLASALGIPGVILLYAVFVRAMWVSAADALSRESGERILLTGFWAATAGYLTHLLFGLSVTGSSFLLWVCVAMLMVATATTIEIKPSNAVWRTVVAALVIVVALAGTFFNIQYFRADHEHLLSKIGVLTNTERVAATQASIDLNPYNDMYRAELGLAYTDLVIAAINQAESARTQGGDPSGPLAEAKAAFLKAEESMRDVIEFIPPEYDNYVFLSNLYNLAGSFFNVDAGFPANEAQQHFESAVDVAERGIEVEPFGPAIRVQAGRAYIALERYDEAIEDLEFAAEMDPNYAEPRMLLGRAYYLSGEPYVAAVWLADALEVQKQNPEVLDMLGSLLRQTEADPEADPELQLAVFAVSGRYVDPQYSSIAASVSQAALSGDPDPQSYRFAAYAYYDIGEFETAVGHLETFAELEPDRRLTLRMLSQWYEAEGDYASAADWLEKLNEIDAGPEREKKIDQLREQAGE